MGPVAARFESAFLVGHRDPEPPPVVEPQRQLGTNEIGWQARAVDIDIEFTFDTAKERDWQSPGAERRLMYGDPISHAPDHLAISEQFANANAFLDTFARHASILACSTAVSRSDAVPSAAAPHASVV